MEMSKLAKALQNSDIVLAIGMVVIVCMMVIPLPAALLDILLTINISLAVVILLVCLYTKEPLDYSSFPTTLLIATLFRLGLNVSSTRLILIYGQAGNVIDSFGQFVVGGNYIVGFVIFAILVLINFMVITGGSTRVAEVSARFSLDKMPGKQLSIDADLNSGLINEEQAKERRKNLEKETDFYGTMDGASKFVKGDAAAGIVITIVNIVGGLIIGVIQQHMDVVNALQTYTVLTVGDGLVSQIPALLISTATGLIVSRASGRDESLSADLKNEMFSDPRILGVVSGLLFTLGLVPGMPTIPFFIIGGAAGAYAYSKYKEKTEMAQKEKEQKAEEEQKEKIGKKEKRAKATKESVMELLNVDVIEIEVGYRLVQLLNVEMGGDLLERIAQIRRQTALDLGIVLPSIRVRDNLQLSPNTYQIKLKGVALESGEVYPDRYLAMCAEDPLGNLTINGIHAVEPAFGLPALWIEGKDKDMAEMSGYTVVSASAVISTHITEVIKKCAHEIVSRYDIQQLIDNLKKEISEDYVNEIMKEVTIGDIQIVIQNLLREGVAIRDLKTILETISIQARINKAPIYLTEQVRQALARNICKQNLADTGDLYVITLAPEIENVIARGASPDAQSVTLDPVYTRALHEKMHMELEKAIAATGNQPVILCSPPIRFLFRKLVERYFPHIAIMSYNEITPNVKLKSVGAIRMDDMKK